MQSKILIEGPARMIAGVMETGEEVVATLTRFATDRDLGASEITAIGAFQQVVLGFYDFSKRDYKPVLLLRRCASRPIEEPLAMVLLRVRLGPG